MLSASHFLDPGPWWDLEFQFRPWTLTPQIKTFLPICILHIHTWNNIAWVPFQGPEPVRVLEFQFRPLKLTPQIKNFLAICILHILKIMLPGKLCSYFCILGPLLDHEFQFRPWKIAPQIKSFLPICKLPFLKIMLPGSHSWVQDLYGSSNFNLSILALKTLILALKTNSSN
jgi:hypothetical protein